MSLTLKQTKDILASYSVEAVVCPRCEAKLTESCVTVTGKKTKPHVPRWAPLLEAFLAGVRDAES